MSDIPEHSVDDEQFCWNDFVSWCGDNGVGLGYVEDWAAWWNCWCDGIIAHQNQIDKL